MTNGMHDDDPFWNTVKAADYLGLMPQTLEKMRMRGEGPPYRKHGRAVRYTREEIDAWSQTRSQIATGWTARKRQNRHNDGDDKSA